MEAAKISYKGDMTNYVCARVCVCGFGRELNFWFDARLLAQHMNNIYVRCRGFVKCIVKLTTPFPQ